GAHQAIFKQSVSSFRQTFHQRLALCDRDHFKNAPCDVEDRPIVDLQNLLPFSTDRSLIQTFLASQLVNRIHALQFSCKTFMEDESVCQDSRSHSPGLLTIFLEQ